jgi:surface carbohydrate biosynthesis protein (TIGR04326 family)
MRNIVIWGLDKALESERIDPDAEYLFWCSYAEKKGLATTSIPRYVEENADSLRSRYLEWVFDLGETCLGNARVVDILQVRKGLSLWWMNPIAEKCNYDKSYWINDAIKLMALDNWLRDRVVASITLITDSDELAECIERLCGKLSVPFIREKGSQHSKETLSVARSIYRQAPHRLRALVWLIHHVAKRWALRGLGLNEWKASRATRLFVSYLLYLTPESASGKKYESRYWADLPERLVAKGTSSNWLHIFVQDGQIQSSRVARKLLSKFNAVEKGGQVHVSLHSFLSFRLVMRTIVGCFRFTAFEKSVGRSLSQTTSRGLELWPLYKSEWADSMSGATAMSNHLYVNLFEEAMRVLPTQDTGVYLQENMDWEPAFIWAWRNFAHGRLIGHPHATVRYWDLRYYSDPRAHQNTRACPLPVPDLVALNGPAAVESYRSAGYPMTAVVEVEALRYLHFGNSFQKSPVRRFTANSVKNVEVLVLCDYSKRHTDAQIGILVDALKILGLGERVTVTVKPHVSMVLTRESYPALRFRLSTESISNLLSGCDIAFTSTATSAAVDAYYAGVPVAIYLDPTSLNLSALRKQKDVQFVTTPEELAAAISLSTSMPLEKKQGNQYFNLTAELPSWQRLLMSNASSD